MIDKWDRRFMNIAMVVSTWSSCIRPNRQVGAVAVRDKRILTTGYNGAAAGTLSCADKGFCIREVENIPSGTQHEKCFAVHAEQNAIAQAAYIGVSLKGATLYTTLQPCTLCSRQIVNAGIVRVVYCGKYSECDGLNILMEAGIEVDTIPLD
jgi:dCMP deaminase